MFEVDFGVVVIVVYKAQDAVHGSARLPSLWNESTITAVDWGIQDTVILLNVILWFLHKTEFCGIDVGIWMAH